MFNDNEATHQDLVAKVVARPEFAGTLHDNKTAQSLGYPAALVPGIDIYAYLSSFALKSWGADWLIKGTLMSTSLRPVYHEDRLIVSATAAQRRNDTKIVDLTAHKADSVLVATGRATLADETNEAPDPSVFPILARPFEVPPGGPESLQKGMSFTSVSETVSGSDNARISKEFLEPSPFYEAQGIVHPAYLQRLALRNAHSSFAHSTPPIFISTDTTNFSPLHVGETIDTPGFITKLWERNGHHYMESEQLVVANGKRPVLLIRRVTIYQARKDSSSRAPDSQKVKSDTKASSYK